MSDAVTEIQQDAEERSEVEFGIAEQIALLSQASEAPTEFEPAGRAFDQDEVDFGRRRGWRASLRSRGGFGSQKTSSSTISINSSRRSLSAWASRVDSAVSRSTADPG